MSQSLINFAISNSLSAMLKIQLIPFRMLSSHAAFKRVSRLEGIIPALETSHALAYLEKLCPTLPDGVRVVVNCSGRGDKDVHTASKYLDVWKNS